MSAVEAIEPAIREAAYRSKIEPVLSSLSDDGIPDSDAKLLLNLGYGAKWYYPWRRLVGCSGTCLAKGYAGNDITTLDGVVRLYNTADTWAALALIEGTKVAPLPAGKSWNEWPGYGRPDMSKEIDELASIRAWIDTLRSLPWPPSQAVLDGLTSRLLALMYSIRGYWYVWKHGFLHPIMTDTRLSYGRPVPGSQPASRPNVAPQTWDWKSTLSSLWAWLTSLASPSEATQVAEKVQQSDPEKVRDEINAKAADSAAAAGDLAESSSSPVPPPKKATGNGAAVAIGVAGLGLGLLIFGRQRK